MVLPCFIIYEDETIYRPHYLTILLVKNPYGIILVTPHMFSRHKPHYLMLAFNINKTSPLGRFRHMPIDHEPFIDKKFIGIVSLSKRLYLEVLLIGLVIVVKVIAMRLKLLGIFIWDPMHINDLKEREDVKEII
ncbi:hypothetical protein ACJX0J_032894 [Zea mays]